MVDADRVKSKLPSFLVDNCSYRNKKVWSAYMRMRFSFGQFEK